MKYFVRVTGACNGYVATGVPGERWIRRINSGSSGNSGGSSGNSGGSNNGGSSGGSNNNQPTACRRGDRVSVGDRARIEPEPPIANILRAGSSQSSADIGRIQPGEAFDVIGGPICNGRYKMWQVETDAGIVGWTAEGDDSEYWIGWIARRTDRQNCSVPLRAYSDSSRGGEILEIPLSPLPDTFTLYFEGRLVPDSEWGVQHNGYAGESNSNATYLGIGKRWIANPRNWNWNDDTEWFISYTCSNGTHEKETFHKSSYIVLHDCIVVFPLHPLCCISIRIRYFVL